MLGSCCRIAEACRAESIRRGRSRSLLNGKGGVALTRFFQTCRDLLRDSGTFFSPKLIIFQQSLTIGHRVHQGNAGRLPRILHTKTSAKTDLTQLPGYLQRRLPRPA